jgi:sodium-dependent dicarboxylate transporter 2/3/5
MPQMKDTWRLDACLALGAGVWALAPEPGSLRAGLALFALIGSLWMTQAINLTITALLVPLLAVLAGLLDTRAALAAFANPIIFLFLGGFVLATALQRHGLDREFAGWVLRRARGERRRAVWLLFGMTALLSMWISNTATAAIMLPLALGLLVPDGAGAGAAGDALPDAAATRERTYVLLGVAYSASIGGLGTLVGSPPNAIAAGHAGISFVEWLAFGIPLVLLLMPLMVLALTLTLRPALTGRLEVAPGRITWTRERRIVVAVFLLAAAGWIGGAPLSAWLGIKADFDTLVALAVVVALVATRVLDWESAERGTQWGVLLLFGGGLALNLAMEKSGASRFLADALIDLFAGAPVLLLLLVVLAFVVFLSELASNTATAALLVPVFAGMAGAFGLSPAVMAVAIAAAASCGFMLPVATPPNALVYGTGLVPAGTMMRAGLVLNVLCVLAITLLVTLW